MNIHPVQAISSYVHTLTVLIPSLCQSKAAFSNFLHYFQTGWIPTPTGQPPSASSGRQPSVGYLGGAQAVADLAADVLDVALVEVKVNAQAKAIGKPRVKGLLGRQSVWKW